MKHIPVVSKRGFIINGNHRIARAIELGIDPIPVLKEI
jgi:ParB-like chromosome segregation protein Spo0J